VGYTKYIDLVRSFVGGKEIIQTGMTREVERVVAALDAAARGKRVALIGTGDAGIYGLAGLALELAEKRGDPFPVRISPGITAAVASAAVVGAPLTNDFITLSLSDLLTPREAVIARIEAAAVSGMATVVYNPKSRKRTELIAFLRETFLRHRSPETPVAIVTHALRAGQAYVLSTLRDFIEETITMNSTIIIGNGDTIIVASAGGPRMVTRRGYERKEKESSKRS
jgi:precorrin-3B C17-methyltransferase